MEDLLGQLTEELIGALLFQVYQELQPGWLQSFKIQLVQIRITVAIKMFLNQQIKEIHGL